MGSSSWKSAKLKSICSCAFHISLVRYYLMSALLKLTKVRASAIVTSPAYFEDIPAVSRLRVVHVGRSVRKPCFRGDRVRRWGSITATSLGTAPQHGPLINLDDCPAAVERRRDTN